LHTICPNLQLLSLRFSHLSESLLDPYDLNALLDFTPLLHKVALEMLCSKTGDVVRILDYVEGQHLLIDGFKFRQDYPLVDEDLLIEFEPVKIIRFCKVNFIPVENVLTLLCNCHFELEYLQLEDYHELTGVVNVIYDCEKLKVLQLAPLFSVSEFETFNKLSNLKELRSLGIGGIHHVNCRILQKVSLLNNSEITDRGIMKLLTFSNELEFLSLNLMHSVHGFFLSFISAKAPNLKQLMIRNCTFMNPSLLSRCSILC